MDTDWKEALSQLGSVLPQAEPEPETIAGDNTGAEATPAKGTQLKMAVEKKGRGGKTATIIWGFEGLDDDRVAEVARRLKQSLGIGGSSRGGEILLQGDVRGKAAEKLREMGYAVKG